MPHAKAVVAGRTIAETDDYEVVEGNIYVCIVPIPCDFQLQLELTITVPSFVRGNLLTRRKIN